MLVILYRDGMFLGTFIAERLSVRLVIMQAWRALVGPWSEFVVVVVCLSVTGLRLHSLRTFLARSAHS